MFEYINNPATLIIWTGALLVLWSASMNFNNTHLMLEKQSDNTWLGHLKISMSMHPGKDNLLLRPASANTTIFRYRLYQFVYSIIALLIYLALLMPVFVEQMQEVIKWFSLDSIPNIINSEPLVVAAFVIFILPNVPPFRWADVKLRSLLYERALIPAQQLREMHRLEISDYYPPAKIIKKVKEHAIAEDFDASDIVYNSEFDTTQSLWTKCIVLVNQIKIWEADDHYKTPFSILKEPQSNIHTVQVIKDLKEQLMSDAKKCFSQLRENSGEKSEELKNLEAEFRNNCRQLLQRIYALLACISLQSHYSDRERIIKFNELGFRLKANQSGPIPNLNDMLILTIILCTLLVLPLGYRLGITKAIMIGAIMFSAVLTPIILAHVFPKLCIKKIVDSYNQYVPNVRYPIISALIAAILGFIIFSVGGMFIEPSDFCSYTGYERYTNCSYPWGFIHAGVAMILAIRLSVGTYPDVLKLHGFQKYRQWGNFKDAIICSSFLVLISIFLVVPHLETLRETTIDGSAFFNIVIRMGIIAFVLGFIVPTWYRAHNQLAIGERRRNHKQRKRFIDELNHIKKGIETTEGI